MTIIALVIGLCITLALIFFNFSLAFTLKLLQTGSVPLGRYLFMISICAVNTGVVLWLAYILKKAQTEKPTAQSMPTRQNPQQHIRGPYAPQAESNPQQLEQQEQSKRLIIALAQSQTHITLNDIMSLTGLNANESEKLITELILAEQLSIENGNNGPMYSLSNPKINYQNKEEPPLKAFN